MKICYINPTNNIRRPIAELATMLREQRHSVSVMYPISKGCPTENWIANQAINNTAIKGITIPSWYFSPLRYSFPNPVALLQQIRAIFHQHDIIHIWEYYYPLSIGCLLYAAFSRERRQKTILTTDGFVGYSYQPKKPWWLSPMFRISTQLFARFLFRIPRAITTYGKSMLPYAAQVGIPEDKIKVIPTGIHPERFQKVSPEKVESLKREFSIRQEKVILFVGMLTERKGVDKVICVSQQLLEEGINIKTIIIGDAHGENRYPEIVKNRWKEKIIFAGGRKDIPELMHLADVLLLPSEGEGLPGVVMEAMAAGLPVVATKEGCTPDLITTGKEGFLVEGGGEYLSAVRNILQDEKHHQALAAQAQQKIKLFSWKKVFPRYLALYAGKEGDA